MTQGMVCHQTFQDKNGKWLFPTDVERDGDDWVMRSDNGPVTAGRIEKMSKSKRNVVDPEIIIDTYGADTARLFMLSDSPPERDMEWTESGVEGASRFLKKIWRLAADDTIAPFGTDMPDKADPKSHDLVKTVHKTILAITKDIEEFRFNRAVAQLHTLSNAISNIPPDIAGSAEARRFAIERLAMLIAPLTPHIAEEIWRMLGHDNMLADTDWPVADPALAADDEVEIGVQVNGKLRATITLPRDCPNDEAEAKALASDGVSRYLEGKAPKRVIVVPNRIINVVA
jgi:leucyl-tRNA synthetase